VLTPERVDGLLLMRHEHATHAPGELLEIGETATGPDLVLQHAPEAFNQIFPSKKALEFPILSNISTSCMDLA
jgi:hypothetical protein